MKKRLLYVLIGGGALLLALALIFGIPVLKYYRGTAVTADAVVFLPTGSSYGQMSDSLRASGVLKDEARFFETAQRRSLDQSVRPGRYQLKAGMTYAALINTLRGGWQSPVRVTFNPMRSLDRLAGIAARRLEPDSLSFLLAFNDETLIEELGFNDRTFIGMFIPNTYELYWTTTPEEFLRRMKREYERFWEARTAKLARSGLTREQAITLASIVYEETKVEDEMSVVAGVYVNRLRIGMPLQADPTVKFAVGDFTLRRVLFRHLEVDSPYNTYKYAGLPPGPICMPSIAAIDAVIDYADHNYLYFCAKEDLSGAHNFAVTLAQHNRNAQAYAAALNRLGIR